MAPTTSAAPQLLKLTVSRTIDAPPADVFAAWVDPAQASAWFGNAQVIMHPAVDDLYYISVPHQDRGCHIYGRFLRIERPRLVEQTWMSESTHGLESIVTFSIEPRGRGSEVTIHHAGLPNEEERQNHQDGWTSLLDAMEKHVKGRSNA